MNRKRSTGIMVTKMLTVTAMGLAGFSVLLPAGCSGDSSTQTSGQTTRSGAGGAGDGGSGGAGGIGGSGGSGGAGGAMPVCVPGAAESCYSGPSTTNGVGPCKAGTKTCLQDGAGYGPCMGETLPQTEICNDVDEDCDGIINNGVLITYHPDMDNDGYGDPTASVQACSAPNGFVADGTDCDDTNPNVNPGGVEVANGFDDNCNGQLNEGVYFPSCKAILASLPGSASGPYTIDPDGAMGAGIPFDVSCDMVSDGGGWTLLARTNGPLDGMILPWVDILSLNFFFTAGAFTTSQAVPAGYLSGTDFFAILRAAADLPFSELRLNDNKGISLQSTASPKTLRTIHDATGVEPLYRNGLNTGVLLLLGNANHTGMVPCYYPNIDAQSCQTYFMGDTGNESTAFYVGDLDKCAGGPAPGDLSYALWGSGDCYATDAAGGFGGFTFRRPFHIQAGRGGYVDSGFAAGGWSIQVR